MTRMLALLTGVAVLGTAAMAAAQAPASPILSTLEVQQIAASDEPADHARLSRHFAALAEREDAEARRHSAMSKSYAGTASRGLRTGMQAHCTRLGELATESAATLRELAGYHAGLAKGVPATAPAGAAAFEAGTGARTPSDAELNALAAKATTPSDHAALQEYFQNVATRATADAEQHAALGQAMRGRRSAAPAQHHERLAALARDAAAEATTAAAMHRDLAGSAR